MALLALLERLVSQEVSRANAVRASARLTHGRLQRERVEVFLSQLRRDQTNQQPTPSEVTADGVGQGGGR